MIAPLFNFDELCLYALDRAGKLSPEARASIMEDLRLRMQYPGEYVAYIDRYETDADGTRLARQVLAHGRHVEELRSAIEACSQEDRVLLMLNYVDPLDAPLTTPMGLPGRE